MPIACALLSCLQSSERCCYTGTAGDKMWFPNYTEMAVSSDAYNLLCSENSSTAFPVWYGEVLNYIPYTLNLSSLLALLKVLLYPLLVAPSSS